MHEAMNFREESYGLDAKTCLESSCIRTRSIKNTLIKCLPKDPEFIMNPTLIMRIFLN